MMSCLAKAGNPVRTEGSSSEDRDEAATICVIQSAENTVTETFIRAHVEHLPAPVRFITGHWPSHEGRPLLSSSGWARAWRKAGRSLRGLPWSWNITLAYLEAFRRYRPAAVLAEYGPSGVLALEACRLSGLPLIVHFHGYDASVEGILTDHRETYPHLFRHAAAVIAVSRHMQAQLLSLGAPPDKLFYNPYGVDCSRFGGATPAESEASFLAVGRLVEKKAPHLTILAFAEVHRLCPGARLRMIGQGPLEGVCRDLVRALQLEEAVTFLGAQPPEVVRLEMRRARGFVQHSVRAASGDCEGTPVAVLEAGASGLPVIATRHAGIADVVDHGRTGLLCDERDVSAMATHLVAIARNPGYAHTLGSAARERIQTHFGLQASIARLWEIISSCIRNS